MTASTTARRSAACGPCGARATTCTAKSPCRSRSGAGRAGTASTPRCSTQRCTRAWSGAPASTSSCPSPGPTSGCTARARSCCACGWPRPDRTRCPWTWPTRPARRSPRSVTCGPVRSRSASCARRHGPGWATRCSASSGRPSRRSSGTAVDGRCSGTVPASPVSTATPTSPLSARPSPRGYRCRTRSSCPCRTPRATPRATSPQRCARPCAGRGPC